MSNLKKVKKTFYLFLAVVGITLLVSSHSVYANRKSTSKATEDNDEVVKNKLFAKKSKIELGGPDFGMIFNQAYVSSLVLHANANYYWKENWGFSLEILAAFNNDKFERGCIENFLNDFNNEISSACSQEGEDPAKALYTGELDINGDPAVYPGTNLGPAYVPIRELGYLLTGAAIWNPVYGKQLAFLRNTIHFDLFITMGAGLSFSKFYKQSKILKNGALSRGEAPDDDDFTDDCNANNIPGICPDSNGEYLNYVGKAGRPDPKSEIHPTFTLGVGQKFHFKEKYHIKAELRNYTLVGTFSGIDSFFMGWLGVGMRF